MNRLIQRVGEIHTTNQGYEIEIVEYYKANNCTIKFKNGLLLKNINYANIKKGNVRYPLHPSVYNVGFMGIGSYTSRINSKETKYYKAWNGVLERVYSEKLHKVRPTYIGCSVAEEWHNFQNFAKWFEENYIEGWQLDKDILVKGNRIYSPDTCCFVPPIINTLIISCKSKRGNYPIGVCKVKNKYICQTNSYSVRNNGTFSTPEEAFQVYKEVKEKHIKEVADKWKGLISDKVYQAMYNYKVEITD